jgi:multidrug efflux pump subunit AcrA (membrane-fusion protein)
VLTVVTLSIVAMCVAPPAANLLAFQEGTGAGSPGAKPGEQEVVIKREALKLTDPKVYRASLHLQAARTLELTAPADGVVRTVTAKPGAKLNQQAETIRLDDHRQTIVLKRAKALLQAAKLEKQIAQPKADNDLTALAEARLEAAQAEVELAQFELDELIVRAPFTGEIERVFVVEGQYVRAGERLATLVDSSKLSVEIPVERQSATVGGTIDLRVEDTPVKAKVESVSALTPAFEALRELTISPATAVVTIENGAGRFASGQTVYCDLIPLMPVTVVPTIAVSNVSDGSRRVQVLRENVVRDLTIRILGKVGADDIFVSGRFSDGDEVIVSSTRALADGTPLRAILSPASTASRGAAGTARPGETQTPGGTKKPPVGF